jgi:hypothetical protein
VQQVLGGGVGLYSNQFRPQVCSKQQHCRGRLHPFFSERGWILICRVWIENPVVLRVVWPAVVRQLCSPAGRIRESGTNILLHVWGFLGNVTWALSRGGAVVHCCVSLTTQQFKRKAYQQHCCARDNSHGDVSMVTGLLSMDFYWYRQSCFEIARVETCVCIWLRTPVGWKSELVFRDRTGWTCTGVRRAVDCV